MSNLDQEGRTLMSINTSHQGFMIRVLLADPDESLLARYRVFLSRNGFEVSTAANGADCLLRLRNFKPHVLVLDPEMPWRRGDNTLARMLEEHDVARVPVLLLSADYDHVLRPAHSMHLAKPLAPELLAQRIRLEIDQRYFTSNGREGRECPESQLATAYASSGPLD
jgi:DNA-binding response OmpR family regulator